MAAPEERNVLTYEQPPPKWEPGPLTAFLFATPGLACWILFVCMIRGAGSHPFVLFALGMLLVAIGTALTSFFFYWQRPKRWYVVLCLTANGVGLLVPICLVTGDPFAWLLR